MWKYSLFLIPIAIIFGLYWFEYISVSWESIRLGKTRCPYYITSGSQHGDIHMPVRTIFGYESKGGEKLYDIIRDDTFIFSAYFFNDFDKIFKCFRTEELAVANGYTKFLSDQAARKKKRLDAQEGFGQMTVRLMKDRDPNSATDTAKLLQSIDSVIGL